MNTLRKFVFSFLLVTILGFGAAAQPDVKSKTDELPVVISEMDGADSERLLNNAEIKIRLQKLLGKKNYTAFLESFEIITPVIKEGDFLFASGCLIHACNQLESAIAIDSVSKTINAAIYRRGEKTKYFNENRRNTPKLIKNWAARLASRN